MATRYVGRPLVVRAVPEFRDQRGLHGRDGYLVTFALPGEAFAEQWQEWFDALIFHALFEPMETRVT